MNGNKNGNNFIQNETFWRFLANFWTLAFMATIVANFTAEGAYDVLIGPFSILYAGILTIYVGTKEFDRWYKNHESIHPGEIFVIAWTVLMVGLFISSITLDGDHGVSSDVVAVYIAVLTLFAFTQKSKSLHKIRKSK